MISTSMAVLIFVADVEIILARCLTCSCLFLESSIIAKNLAQIAAAITRNCSPGIVGELSERIPLVAHRILCRFVVELR